VGVWSELLCVLWLAHAAALVHFLWGRGCGRAATLQTAETHGRERASSVGVGRREGIGGARGYRVSQSGLRLPRSEGRSHAQHSADNRSSVLKPGASQRARDVRPEEGGGKSDTSERVTLRQQRGWVCAGPNTSAAAAAMATVILSYVATMVTSSGVLHIMAVVVR
jgi:hypothetical protein